MLTPSCTSFSCSPWPPRPLHRMPKGTGFQFFVWQLRVAQAHVRAARQVLGMAASEEEPGGELGQVQEGGSATSDCSTSGCAGTGVRSTVHGQALHLGLEPRGLEHCWESRQILRRVPERRRWVQRARATPKGQCVWVLTGEPAWG